MAEKKNSMVNNGDGIQQKIYSVSELNANVKSLLEERFPFIWIFGEISDFRIPISGHFYFSLKDDSSQINAVMFRGQQRNLTFEPEDGMSVTGMGRISVYEPRGTYQIILEYLEPSGIGALQIAFEKLKKRLAEEGLFDDAAKVPIAFFPKKISIITSPSGAVMHDILEIVNRRCPNVSIQIVPVKVQGPSAVDEIVSAIKLVNDASDADTAILARGGGSLEDLQAFNSEQVAMAIFESKIPVVSAVGHETDYTISDFVADLRAPTPSAAAELVVPEKSELLRCCNEIRMRLELIFKSYYNNIKTKLNAVSKRLIDPRRKIEDFRMRMDDLTGRLNRHMRGWHRRELKNLNFWIDRLEANSPKLLVRKIRNQLEQNYNNLLKSYLIYINSNQIKIRELSAKLAALSPVAILSRGYSITRTIPDATVVKDPRLVSLNQQLEVMVAKGRLLCRLEGKSTNGEKNF